MRKGERQPIIAAGKHKVLLTLPQEWWGKIKFHFLSPKSVVKIKKIFIFSPTRKGENKVSYFISPNNGENIVFYFLPPKNGRSFFICSFKHGPSYKLVM